MAPECRKRDYRRDERGQAIAPVGVTGVMPANLSLIADVAGAIVSGSADLPIDGILMGRTLADDLGLRVGQIVRLRSDRGRERSFHIGGIFALGIASADRQSVYMNFTAARALFDLPSGISRIEIKVAPVADAPRIAEALRRATGLKTTAWMDENAQLFEALDAQGRTGTIIKLFALITIVVVSPAPCCSRSSAGARRSASCGRWARARGWSC